MSYNNTPAGSGGGGGGGVLVGCRYTRASTQSLTGSAFTVFNFDTADYDTGSLVTTGAGWVFTAPSTGYYTLEFFIRIDDNRGWEVSSFINGVEKQRLHTFNASAANQGMGGADTYALNAGDTLDVRVYNPGATVSPTMPLTNFISVIEETAGGGSLIGGNLVKFDKVVSTTLLNTTSTSLTPIDSTNIGYTQFEYNMRVGDIFVMTLSGQLYSNTTANYTYIDMEIDQPTSGDIYLSAGLPSTQDAVYILWTDGQRHGRTLSITFIATETGIHKFRPVWKVGGGQSELDGANTPTTITGEHLHVTDDLATTTLNFTFDGGGAALTTGEKYWVQLDFDCTIVSASLTADQTGSIVIDIWKDSYANFPPINADSITAAAPPTISSALKSRDTTLTGWITTITADDYLKFNIDSVTAIEVCTLSLKVTVP